MALILRGGRMNCQPMTTTFGSTEQEPAAFAVGHGATTHASSVRAARHSRRVRMLRIAIPVGIVLVVGGVALVSMAQSAAHA